MRQNSLKTSGYSRYPVVLALGLEVPTVFIDYTRGQGKTEHFGEPYRSLSELDANFLTREVAQFLETPLPQTPSFAHAFTGTMQPVLTKLGFTTQNTKNNP